MDGYGYGGKTPFPLCDVVISISPSAARLFCLWRLGVDLYRGSFMKVSSFYMAKAVDTNTSTDTGGSCPYGYSLNFLEASNASPFDLGVSETHNSSLICPDFVIKGCIPERKHLKRRFPRSVTKE
jgi:hypothetical protein